jgi:8-oxo-dGTP pyrophosphatase MutT (NUDIX family)
MTGRVFRRRTGTIIHRVNRDDIKRRLENTCPGEETGQGWHLPADPALAPVSSPVPAAVLIGLVGSPNGPEIILTQRTAALRNHPAEISLPGGRVEPGDSSPQVAALREAAEEVGLPPERVEILGCLPLYRTVSDYCVHPFVGWIEPPVTFVPDEREVADVFLVPLEFVLDPANHQRGTLLRDGQERSFYVLAYPGRRIWGATAGILVNLARALG